MKLKYLTIILIVELQSGIGLLEMETELYGGIILFIGTSITNGLTTRFVTISGRRDVSTTTVNSKLQLQKNSFLTQGGGGYHV